MASGDNRMAFVGNSTCSVGWQEDGVVGDPVAD